MCAHSPFVNLHITSFSVISPRTEVLPHYEILFSTTLPVFLFLAFSSYKICVHLFECVTSLFILIYVPGLGCFFIVQLEKQKQDRELWMFRESVCPSWNSCVSTGSCFANSCCSSTETIQSRAGVFRSILPQ